MPRKKLIRNDTFPYHLSNRTHDRRFYDLDPRVLWRIYCEELCIASWSFGLQIHAFVLMQNHYHLVASTPDSNLDETIGYFQSKVSQRVCAEAGTSQHTFQTRYRWSLITELRHYLNVYRYVYQNPLRAGICSKISAYPLSTAHARLGYSKLELPLRNHIFYEAARFEDLVSEEEWLEELLCEEDLEELRLGLRRATYKPGDVKKWRYRNGQRGGVVGKRGLAP
jgi:putative transposase